MRCQTYMYSLFTVQEVCMGESSLQNERSEVFTHDRGQDSPIQAD